MSFTITLNGDVGQACAAAPVFNTAYARTGCVEAFSNTVGNVVPGLALVLAKQLEPPSPVPGGPVTYRLIVTNAGTATITDLGVTDTVSPVLHPAGLPLAADQPAPFVAPAVAQAAGGTRYVWSGTGLAFAPGMSYTFTLTGTVGVVYAATAVSNTFFAASGACLALNSNAVDFPITPVLEITITSATSMTFTGLTPGAPQASATTFDIVNSGNVPHTLAFTLTVTAGAWQPVDTGAPGFNQFELQGQFNAPGPPGAWSSAAHAFHPAPGDASGASKFNGNETGEAVPAGQARHLWIRILPPSSTDDPTRQRFQINITAQAP
jgi:uncharacterized repeat protein (TIGR01451 family)